MFKIYELTVNTQVCVNCRDTRMSFILHVFLYQFL